MMPDNPLVGGVALRRPAIQSPNFVQSPLTGWAINADGSAYFANLTLSGTFNGTDYLINSSGAFFYNGTPANGNLIVSIASAAGSDSFGNSYPKGLNVTTGTISGTTFNGTDFILNTAGLFLYSSTPAAGNLIGSWASASGSDGFGNTYPAGLQVGNSTDSAQALLTRGAGGGAAEIQFPVPSLSLSNTPNLGGGIVSGTYADMLLSGPALSTASHEDWVQFVLYSNDSGSNAARCEFRYIDTSGTPHVMGSFNGTNWVFGGSGTVTLGASASFVWTESSTSLGLPSGGGPFVSGESFHAISLASGTTGLLSGGNGMRVKLLPWNAVWLDIEFSYTGTGGTTFNFGSLPSASYYPNVARHFPLETNGNLSATTPGVPRVAMPTSGAVQVIVPAMSTSTTYTIGGSIMYPTN